MSVAPVKSLQDYPLALPALTAFMALEKCCYEVWRNGSHGNRLSGRGDCAASFDMRDKALRDYFKRSSRRILQSKVVNWLPFLEVPFSSKSPADSVRDNNNNNILSDIILAVGISIEKKECSPSLFSMELRTTVISTRMIRGVV